MKGMGDRQLARFDAHRRHLFGQGENRLPFTGDDDTFRAIDGGNGHFVFIGGKRGAHARFRGQQRNHFAILGQGAHQPPAGCDQLEAIG